MKQITAFSKEALNEKLVFAEIDGNIGVGQIVYDGDDMFVLQNMEEGLESDNITNKFFKYSFIYNEDEIKVFEMSEEQTKLYSERLDVLKGFLEGDTIYLNSSFKTITKIDDNGIFCDHIRLTLNEDFDKVSDKNEFIKSKYRHILDSKFIKEESKNAILKNIKSGKFSTDLSLYITKDGSEIGFYHTENFNIQYLGFNKLPQNYFVIDGIHNDIAKIFAGDLKLNDFDKIIEDINNVFETYTIYNKSFISLIKSLNVNEDLETKIQKGNYYHKMQFIGFDDEAKMITFIPKGKPLVFDDNGVETSKNRQSMKPHKFFNTILKDEASEYDIKVFVDKLLSYKDAYSIRYFRGKKMAENYSTVNTRGWATSSCMDKKAENFFELYTDPKFRLGVIYRDKEVVGRFIEVTCDGGFIYNDRVYYKDEQTLAWYNNWVDKNKLNRKEKNSADTCERFYNVDKGAFTKQVSVSLRKKLDTIKIYPYMDTLSWGYSNKLTNYETTDSRFVFRSTGGHCSRINCKMDIITGKYIDNEFAVSIDFGEHRGNYTTVENLVYSVKNGGHCLK